MKPFDSLSYAKSLMDAGVPRDAAWAQTEVFSSVVSDTLATKIDLNNAIEFLRRDLTIRMGGMLMALGGILIAIKYFG